jgi:lysyl-tRNA synthetase class 2
VPPLRRGDQVAFVLRGAAITHFAVINRAETSVPDLGDWLDDSRRPDRLRFRELDILLNSRARKLVETRSAIIYGIRSYLQQRGFIEVELPVLKEHPDIAPADHFEIANHFGGRPSYLRTTFPPVERLLLSLDRFYTIGPNFRNGDCSYKNTPEFSMFCLAMRSVQYLDAHRFVRTMMAEVVASVTGGSAVSFRGHSCDLGVWREISLEALFEERFDVRLSDLDNDNAMRLFAIANGVEPPPGPGGHLFRAALFDRIFEALIVPTSAEPTFYTDVPWYLAGPAEPHPLRPGLKLRGEGYIAGMEVTNAKNVLTDYKSLRRWHETVAEAKAAAGFGAYARVDEAYLRAVSYGLQPGSLASIGLDRLIMLALGVDNITDAVMYPLA